MQFFFTKSLKLLAGYTFYSYRKPSTIQAYLGAISLARKGRDFGNENAVDGMYTDRGAVGGQCTISGDVKYTATKLFLGI